jgi:transposase
MAKFSKELRVKVMLEIDSGNSISGAARKYGVARQTVQTWYKQYHAGGIEQLVSTKQKYSQAFKLHAIEYRRENGLSYPQAAANLGIPHSGTLYTWEKRYEEQGLDGLQDTRKGRQRKMPKKEVKPDKPRTRERELEAEVAELRMENAYLKKLNALVQEREKSAKKTK